MIPGLRSRWSFAELTSREFASAMPTHLDARFTVVPRRRIVVPLAVGALSLGAAVVLAVAGVALVAVFVLVVGALELGAGATAAMSNRRALDVLGERLLDDPGSRSPRREGEP